MIESFVFWKLPNQAEVYTLENIQVQMVNQPIIDEAGFLFFPYSAQENAYFLKGEIAKCEDKLSDLVSRFELVNEITISNREIDMNPKINNTDSSIYKALIQKAIEEMKAGTFNKVVLARAFSQQLPHDFKLENFFRLLCENYPNAFVYCTYINNKVWIGATPEVFIKKKGSSYLTFALAGTKLQSEFGDKEKAEQKFVKDYIVDILENENCTQINVSELYELNTGNLTHLVNEIKFESNHPNAIMGRLHPTPAVCGTPKSKAQSFISSYENLDRAFYSGFLGPVGANGDFSLWVNLRCAKIESQVITFYSGAGITADSIEENEFYETERKMDTLRGLI
jgi:isochorismate synthase